MSLFHAEKCFPLVSAHEVGITLHYVTLAEMLLMLTVDVFVLIAARVVITQGASLNLFSSREAEYEQRAQLLKRLSFTIYCSDVDQYQRHMPDIQGTAPMLKVKKG